MKYSWKVFLWENGHKSTELTQYLTFPLFIEDRLDEQLDTGEIILDLMPIESKNAFPPKTKIRIERYYEGNFNKKWDLVVSHDDVEEYVGEPKICCHRINLIEASVIAQGMHVDNISLTYRLQDVNLSYITYNSNSIKCEDAIDGINYSNDGWKEPIHPQNLTQFTYGGKEGYKNSFITSYNYVWKNFRSNENKGNIPYVGELLMYYDALESHEITFIPPTLMWQGCPNGNRFEDLYEVPIRVEIYRTETVKGRPIDGTRELVSTKFFESKKTGSADSCVHTIITDGSFRINDSDQVAFYKTIRKIDYERGGNGGFSSYFKTDLGMRDVVGFTSKYRDNEITITTPKLDIDDINNYRGFIYEIECYEENYSTLPIYYEYNILCGAMQKILYS